MSTYLFLRQRNFFISIYDFLLRLSFFKICSHVTRKQSKWDKRRRIQMNSRKRSLELKITSGLEQKTEFPGVKNYFYDILRHFEDDFVRIKWLFTSCEITPTLTLSTHAIYRLITIVVIVTSLFLVFAISDTIYLRWWAILKIEWQHNNGAKFFCSLMVFRFTCASSRFKILRKSVSI